MKKNIPFITLLFLLGIVNIVQAQTTCSNPIVFNSCTPLPYNYQTQSTPTTTPIVTTLSNASGCSASIENNAFFTFVASSTSMSLTIDPGNASTPGTVAYDGGLQVWLFSTADCVTPTVLDCDASGFTTPTSISSTSLVVGQTYYIMLDGFAGAFGSYSFSGFSPAPSGTFPLVTSTDTATCGLKDGNIRILANGGQAPYQYSIDGGGTFAASGTFNGVAGGSYSVVVKDANNCQSTQTVVVPVLSTVASADQVYCVSGGPVTLSAKGGTLFSWSPSAGIVSYSADSSVIQVAPNVNTAYVVTSNLPNTCKNKDTVLVSVAPSFTTTTSNSNPSICLYGSSTLGVVATPSNLGPFTYKWIPAGSALTPDSASTIVKPTQTTLYTVTVSSAAGCKVVIDSFTVTVAGVAPKVSVVSDKNNVCPGDTIRLTPIITQEGLLNCGLNPDGINLSCLNPGTVTAGTDQNPSTDVTPYQTDWRGGKVQYLFRASELQAAGMSSSTITDISFFVSNNPTKTANFPGFNVSMGCYADSVLPSSFVTGLTNVAVPSVNTIDSGLNNIIFDNPYDWDGKSNIVIQLCFTGYTGSTLNSTPVITSNVFANASLSDQTFSTTTSGCGLTFPFASNERPNIKFGLCNPITKFTYNWTPSTGLSCDTCANPYSVVNSDKTYTLFVSDTAGCSGSGTINLTVNPGVPVSAGNDIGLCDGKIGLSVVQLNPAPPACINSYTLTSIPYSTVSPTGAVSIIKAADDSTTAAIPLPFAFDFFCQTQNNLYINANGFITFSAPNYTLAQSRNPLNMPTATVPNNMIALCWDDLSTLASSGGGTIDYFVKGTAPNRVFVVRYNQVEYYSAFAGEAVNGEIQLYEGTNVVEIHTNLVDDNFSDHVMGIEDATGTKASVPPGKNNIDWTVSAGEAWRFTPNKSGLAVTSYAWSPALGLTDSTIFNPEANPTATTTYNVTVTYDNGCKATDDVKVTLSTFPYTISAQPTTVCPGDTAQLSFNGPGVKYQWTPSEFLTDSTIANPKAVITQDQTFRVTASNADNCIRYDSVTIAVRTVQPVSLGDDQDVCACKLTLTPSISGSHYLWSNGDTTVSIIAATSADYSVTVIDNNGCKSKDSVKIDLRCLTVNANAAETNVFSGDSTQLFVDGISYQGNFQYRWIPDTLVLDSTLQRTATTNLTSSTTYTVIVTDLDHGCKATDTITVNVKEAGNFVLPNAFSPNADGKNDHFYPVFLKNTGATVVGFKIYDRWGQLVHDNPAAPGWDGSFKGTAQSSEQYTFFLTVDAPDAKDPSKSVRTEKTGTFALIR